MKRRNGTDTGMLRTVLSTLAALALIGAGQGRAAPAADAPVQIESSVDRGRVRIGDAITYRVTVTYDSTLTLAGAIPKESLAAFEVRDHRATEEECGPGRRSVTEEFVMAGYSPGNHFILPRAYLVAFPDGSLDTLLTAAIPVDVIPTLPEDAADIRDIKGPAEIPSPFPVGWAVGIGVGVLAIAAVLLWFMRWRGRRPRRIVVPPARPAHELAYEALDELRRQNLPGSGQMKAYYIALSETLRRYLGARYRIRAMDRTTTELLQQMRGTESPRDVVARVRGLLEAADHAKFARWQGTLEEAEENMRRSVAIVDATKEPWIQEREEAGVAAGGSH